MTIWRTSDLGWGANQDITQQLNSLLANSLKPGDTLVLEDTYKISGSGIQLPENFTLTAENGGGFDVITTSNSSSSLFVVRSNTTIDNVSFDAVRAPDTGYGGTHPQAGEDYHPQKMMTIYGSDVTIENSSFTGNMLMHLDAHNGDRLTVTNTLFEGGFYQVRLVGSVDDAVFDTVHFKDALGDGIKTERNGEFGPQRATITNSFFEGANRDGIDSAGGFKDAYVADTVFYDNSVSAFDLKTILERPEDLSIYNDNTGIVIERVEIIDSRNAVVVTMLDRMNALDARNADTHMPHDIVVRDSIIEKTPAHDSEVRAFLIKDGYDITWDNLQLLGGVDSEQRIMNAEAPPGWTAYNVGGDATYGAGRNIAVEDLWDGVTGPGAEGQQSQSNPEPVVEEPVASEAPAPAPEPAPDPEPAAPSAPPVADGEVLFALEGDNQFDGRWGSVFQTRHLNELEVEAATISFTFNANDLDGRQGLVSKDAKGLEVNEGHFTSYLDGDTLIVRFQDGSNSEVFRVGNLDANTDYDVVASFGDGKVAVWFDGTLIGEKSSGVTWTDNEEYLQVGANGWASGSGGAGYSDYFNGTISDVTITQGFASTAAGSEEPAPAPIIVVEINEISGDGEVDDREDGAVVISGTAAGAEDGQRIAVAISVGNNPPVYEGTVIVRNGTWQTNPLDFTALNDGLEFNVRASIADGESSGAVDALQTFTLTDTTAPQIISVSVSNDDLVTEIEGSSVTIEGTTAGVENGQDVSVALKTPSQTTVFEGRAAVSNNKWVLEGVDLSSLPPGESYSVVVNVRDSAGNAAQPLVDYFDILEPVVEEPVTQPGTSAGSVLFEMAGTTEFTGKANSVIEIAPSETFKTSAATISFDFNAHTVDGRQGLISKDARGKDVNEGHFLSYIKDGTLFVRFQEGSETVVLRVAHIKENTDYSVSASFGDGKVSLTVNDQLVGERDFDMNWLNNNEFLQIGANGWSSEIGEAGFREVFDGTISSVKIVDNSVPGQVTPEPEPEVLFELEGTQTFNGFNRSVIEVAPTNDLKTDAATISFSFNADDVQDRQGLVSKDARGTDINDGHFTSYVQDGSLYVRFQEGRESALFEVKDIEEGTNYDVSAVFGNGKVALAVNDEVVGIADLDMNWENNGEYLQVGANGWASVSGQAGFTDVFDGTISNLSILDGIHTDKWTMGAEDLGQMPTDFFL